MSMFYGQVHGAARTHATRQGTRESGIRASVQSEHGSVTTEMYDNYGALMVSVRTAGCSKFGGDLIFDGTIEELISRLK